MKEIESGDFYGVYEELGENLTGLVNSEDNHGKWIVGKTYYRVERTIKGGWEIDDPTFIFPNKEDAISFSRRYEEMERAEHMEVSE